MIDGYVFVHSRGFQIKTENSKQDNKSAGRGKGKGEDKWEIDGIDRSIGHEYHGVAKVYSP